MTLKIQNTSQAAGVPENQGGKRYVTTTTIPLISYNTLGEPYTEQFESNRNEGATVSELTTLFKDI